MLSKRVNLFRQGLSVVRPFPITVPPSALRAVTPAPIVPPRPLRLRSSTTVTLPVMNPQSELQALINDYSNILEQPEPFKTLSRQLYALGLLKIDVNAMSVEKAKMLSQLLEYKKLYPKFVELIAQYTDEKLKQFIEVDASLRSSCSFDRLAYYQLSSEFYRLIQKTGDLDSCIIAFQELIKGCITFQKWITIEEYSKREPDETYDVNPLKNNINSYVLSDLLQEFIKENAIESLLKCKNIVEILQLAYLSQRHNMKACLRAIIKNKTYALEVFQYIHEDIQKELAKLRKEEESKGDSFRSSYSRDLSKEGPVINKVSYKILLNNMKFTREIKELFCIFPTLHWNKIEIPVNALFQATKELIQTNRWEILKDYIAYLRSAHISRINNSTIISTIANNKKSVFRFLDLIQAIQYSKDIKDFIFAQAHNYGLHAYNPESSYIVTNLTIACHELTQPEFSYIVTNLTIACHELTQNGATLTLDDFKVIDEKVRKIKPPKSAEKPGNFAKLFAAKPPCLAVASLGKEENRASMSNVGLRIPTLF